ncbi:MAG: sulfatase [Chitinophagaceae bacterium]|nr:sulfatase [Chitinophagaceae bacterium]
MQKKIILIAACTCISVFAFAQQKNATRSKPNIIVIVTDDHRADALGAAGNKIIQTPYMDKLAAEGILYKNAYVTTAICCVSRAGILSGQYVSRHKIEDFATAFSGAALQQTYPLLLRKAGYKTGFIGKFGVGAQYPDPALFDYWGCSREMDGQYYLLNSKGDRVHNTDSVGNSIGRFLEQYADKGPFCLSVSFKAPHELDGNPPTYPVQEKFKDLYTDVVIKEPLTADPVYWDQFPGFFRTDKNIARVRWKPLFSTPQLHTATVKNYYRLITGVDEVIGKMMAKLEALGIADNTVILLMGDNGFSLGEHGLQGKWYAYQESVRVPMILYDPRILKSKYKAAPDAIALNIDIAPTVLSLAGVSIPAAMQGESLLDVAAGKTSRKDFFYKHDFLGTPALPKSEAVISNTMKYILYTEHGYEELFDLVKDPNETKNLVADPDYKQQLERLRKRHKELQKKTV